MHAYFLYNYYAVCMQKQASKVKGPSGMRWHLLILRWCLYMKYFSTKAYETLRGVLKLPSTCSLRDYTHWAEAKPGIYTNIHDCTIYVYILYVYADYTCTVCV